MESTNNKSRALFDKCIGALIFLNILHQIVSSMDLREYQNILAYGDLFYQISMVIFLGEIIYRFFTEKQLGFHLNFSGICSAPGIPLSIINGLKASIALASS